MRRGHIDNPDTYQDLLADPLFAQAFQWLKDNPNPLPRAEPYPIVGDDARAIVIEYTPASPDTGRIETHHEHLDLQINIGPSAERILIANATDLTMTEDLPEQDVSFYATPSDIKSELLALGEFIIFDTETDAHMPQRTVNDNTVARATRLNRKIVIKLRKSVLVPALDL
ncbi:MAG: YhcH/YjgK/YiaL family protein [Candidatus Andersenbacteria bacterium]|nr:YhcH/YjgK/YiaL family protein [Candidatus Andersenbacteria bacterium]